MARQQSNIDLAGSLGATLTPRAPPAGAEPPRSGQNSGLFDMGALYAEALDEVMRRTRSDPRLVPLTRAAQPAWPRATHWPQPVVSYEIEAEVPIEFDSFVAPQGRGLGWFGIAVAWLATVTTGAVIATSLPAHAPTHAHVAGPSVVVVLATASTQATSHPDVTSQPVAAPPTVTFASLPVAVSAPAAAPPSSPVVSTKRIAPRVVATAVARPRPAPAAAPVIAAAAAAAGAAAPVVAPTPRAAVPTRSAPAAVSTAGMSLDELIRHEVQAESAKHR